MNLSDIQIENRDFLNLSYWFSYNENTKKVSGSLIAEIAEKLNKEFNCFNSVSEVASTFKTTFKNALLNLHFFDTDFKNEFTEELGFTIENSPNLDNEYYLRHV